MCGLSIANNLANQNVYKDFYTNYQASEQTFAELMQAATTQMYTNAFVKLAGPLAEDYDLVKNLNSNTISNLLTDEKFKEQFCKVPQNFLHWEQIVEKARSLELINEKSNFWKTAAKVGLAATSALLVLAGGYLIYTNVNDQSMESQRRIELNTLELNTHLPKLCEKAAREFKKILKNLENGPTILMKDYIDLNLRIGASYNANDSIARCTIDFPKENNKFIDFSNKDDRGFNYNCEYMSTQLSDDFPQHLKDFLKDHRMEWNKMAESNKNIRPIDENGIGFKVTLA